VRVAARFHVIARETPGEAWREAQRLLDGIGARSSYSARDSFEVAPNLWAGIALVAGGAATALVGSYDQVAERIDEYHSLGVDEFTLSGYPHLEEALRFGECVRPLLIGRLATLATVE
jgi:alkanesulfonate monooxygenase